MKYLKRFKIFESSKYMPSMDQKVVDEILDRGEFTDEDKMYLDNFGKNNQVVKDLLMTLNGLTKEISQVNDDMRDIYSQAVDTDKPNGPGDPVRLGEIIDINQEELDRLRDKWLDLSKKISKINGDLRYVYKFEDVRYLRVLEYELGLIDYDPADDFLLY
ncbi:MAG: hypothetical protein SLAVMIC_00829 [uncultured marine phage]|uniref:Uncharacterized protein n=1 Tax=uncultured marine phage TaxID=707152 RepID=A0A8D9CAP8_9VIRU|nr:MAG: hypothetical protein SLAVMIC_00829 [uncultured marine phage]